MKFRTRFTGTASLSWKSAIGSNGTRSRPLYCQGRQEPTFSPSLMGDLHSLGYSREAESNADVTGSDICAAAGYNPWGLVWLFQEFQNADTRQLPQLLSDHPANGVRIQTLEKHFRDSPSVFAKFNSDPKSATPFVVSK